MFCMQVMEIMWANQACCFGKLWMPSAKPVWINWLLHRLVCCCGALPHCCVRRSGYVTYYPVIFAGWHCASILQINSFPSVLRTCVQLLQTHFSSLHNHLGSSIRPWAPLTKQLFCSPCWKAHWRYSTLTGTRFTETGEVTELEKPLITWQNRANQNDTKSGLNVWCTRRDWKVPSCDWMTFSWDVGKTTEIC